MLENIFECTNDPDKSSSYLKDVVGHRKVNRAIPKSEGWMEINGKKRRRISTKGWEFEVLWDDSSTSWIPLREIKHSYPLKVAEYVSKNNLADEVAFAWWVKDTMKKRDRVISSAIHRAPKKAFEFRVEIPSSVKHAYQIDR